MMYVNIPNKTEILSNFDPGHLICICKHTLAKRDYNALKTLLFSTRNLNQTPELSEHLKMGWAFLFAHLKEYHKAYEILTTSRFSISHHKTLQNLWFECHYEEEEGKKERKLNPVERYRIRKKFPPPVSISNGEKTLYNILESSINRLYRVFETIKYPDLQQKQMLMRETNLSMDQINNWFKNKRQRLKRNLLINKMK